MQLQKLIILSITFLISSDLISQIKWQTIIGGSEGDRVWHIEETSDENYLLVGESWSSDGDVENNEGESDCLFMKLDKHGELLWLKTFGGAETEALRDIAETKDGGFLLTGYTLSNDGDVTTNNGNYDVVVIKIDRDGNIIWHKLYGGTDKDDSFSICLTQDDGFVLACGSRSSDNNVSINKGDKDAWIIKADSNGEIEWEKSYGGAEDDLAYQILQANNGGYIIGGTTESSDGDIIDSKGDKDIWICHIDSKGKIIWSKTYGGSEFDQLINLKKSKNGGFLITGITNSTDGAIDINYGGFQDIIVIEIDEQGKIIWANTYGGSELDQMADIHENPEGGYWVIGTTSSSDGLLSEPTESDKWWIFKISDKGEFLNGSTFGGNNFDIAFSATVTKNNELVVTGGTNSTEGDFIASQGWFDIVVVKFSDNFSRTYEFENALSFDIFPNPTSTFIELKLEDEMQFSKYQILDSSGLKLEENSLQYPNHRIDISAYQSGIYFLLLQNGSRFKTNRFIVE